MSSKTYWITDPEGVYAQVEGADQRDHYTRVLGWTEVDEPGLEDQVHVINEHPEIGPGRLPYGALADDAWAGRGWKPGPPPGAVAQTPPAAAPAKPTKSTPAAAAGGEQKEK